MLAALKKGDRVITVGGIYGKVVEVRGDSVILDLGDSTVEIGLKYIANVTESRPAASVGKGERKRRPAPRKAASKDQEDQEENAAGEEQENAPEEPAKEENSDEEKK